MDTVQDIVRYSFGICSAYTAVRLKEQCKEPICLYSDTKREDEDTYRFGFEVAKKWNLNMVEASDGRDLWDVFRQENFIPHRKYNSCSVRMKIAPAEAWLKEFCGSANVWFGYDINEEDRAEKLLARWPHSNLTPRFMLMEESVTKAACFGFFQQHGIAPPSIYQHFQHANCLPCKNYSELDWQAFRYYYPEKFEDAQKLETEDGLKWMFGDDRPYLKDLPMIDGAPSRKGRHRLPVNAPEFSFHMDCDACAVD